VMRYGDEHSASLDRREAILRALVFRRGCRRGGAVLDIEVEGKYRSLSHAGRRQQRQPIILRSLTILSTCHVMSCF